MRLVEKDKVFYGLVLADGVKRAQIEGSTADDVWRRLQDEAAKSSPSFFGFDGARARFLRFFPDGFQSPEYAAAERDYKIAAKAKLDATAPLEQALIGTGFGEAALAAFRATNLLYPLEKSRLKSVLRGTGADNFVRAAARFATGDWKPALADMERLLRPHDNAKWTVVTYLPFLWRPDRHMFLKPEVTKDFAARVGHRFANVYEARLDAGVYEALLDLTEEAATQIAELQPRDRIDVQSFLWVVSYYDERAMTAEA